MTLDKTDIKILNLLQQDGRLNNAEIAKKVHLSQPACWRRLKYLEENIIQGYRASINPAAVNLNFYAFMNISLDHHSELSMKHFEDEIMKLDHVIACHNVSGRYDYLLQLVVKDMDQFHKISMLQIRSIGNVKEMNTSFCIKEIKPLTTLPLSST